MPWGLPWDERCSAPVVCGCVSDPPTLVVAQGPSSRGSICFVETGLDAAACQLPGNPRENGCLTDPEKHGNLTDYSPLTQTSFNYDN